MSAREPWPSIPPASSEQQAQQGPPSQGASQQQQQPQQGPHGPPVQYQASAQSGPVLPPPSSISSAPGSYYQTQHPMPLPVIPPHQREPPYPMSGPGPQQANRASLPPQGPPSGEGASQQQQQQQGPAPPSQTLAQGIPAQQIPQGAIPPPNQVPQPVHPRASPPISRAQPQMPTGSAASAHHSLAALAGPNMQQKGGAVMNPHPQAGQVANAAGNGPVGPILNDALSYLDQVKFQFHNQPDVYNKFLDIMKDFKSQSIDTPGVIKRVSTLFSGHPNLVQGFNTFLPPGYIISCSNDPMDTSIRVTTPQGTTTAQPGPPRQMNAPRELTRFYDLPQGSKAWPGAAEGMYGPYAGQPGPPGPDPNAALHEARMREMQQQDRARIAAQQQQAAAAAAQHAQAIQAGNQAGVNQLQNAAAQANGGPRPGMAPAMGIAGPREAQAGAKGPVEFNHAINYVNKIKQRFATQPDIYKNFLEILQTYQREAKPIQDVYSQVTELFKSAPDLLEEFKQFLPESAAQARAAAAAKAAADEAAVSGTIAPGIGPAGPSRLPPVGNFAPPPSASKDAKKKRTQPNGADAVSRETQSAGQSSRAAAHKRTKPTQKPTTEAAPLSPTLTPYKPEAIVQPAAGAVNPDDLAFFDRVKKFIGNKQTYNEFLKLLNLFSQELIDKNTLVSKVENFIGGSQDLMNWFKRFVSYEAKDEVVENLPALMNKVRLSVCRSYGPSYRLLPKAESQRPCSGRDEMCREVLNDEWASHPTWASEDSGFVAHRKNQYEDILHRIEEERHDYDFNIEANLRTIQLLEPIAQKIANLTPEERANFRLHPALDGQSKTIYKRVIKKIYEKEKGNEVIEMLHSNPCVVVPIVLKRLKQKDEEWKLAQREWNKVWREQTAKAFWRSLDHHGISVKVSDRKNYLLKNLVTEIQTKHKEQLVKRQNPNTPVPDYQFKYRVEDMDVLMDATKLLTVMLDHTNAHSAADKDKMDGFIRSFIPLFFDTDSTELQERLASISRSTPDEDGELEHGRVRRHARDQESLLKGVFKRKGNRRQKEGSVASGSKESTPEPHITDEDVNMEQSEAETNTPIGTWIRPPKKFDSQSETDPNAIGRSVSPGYQQRRTVFSLFCNNQTYAFLRSFQLVYQRLLDIKNCEEAVARDIENRKKAIPARELGLLINPPEEYFANTEPGANYYKQVIDMCEQFILGEIESQQFEDGLRQVYIQKGWQLYTIDKLLSAVLKYIHAIINSEKTGETILLFQKDRQRKEMNANKSEYMNLIDYRNKVENLLQADEPLFRIDWNEVSKDLSFTLVTKNDLTVSSTLTPEQKWNHYMQSFTMIIPTEGIPPDYKAPLLKRNLPSVSTPPTAQRTPADTPHPPGTPTSSTPAAIPAQASSAPTFWGTFLDARGAVSVENLELKICVNTYKMFFSGHEILIKGDAQRREVTSEVKDTRQKRWAEKVLGAQPWIKEVGEEEVKRRTEAFRKGEVAAPFPVTATEVAAAPVDEDVEMKD